MIESQSAPDFWRGKKVAVTGGMAMIGAELCRQLIDKNPADLWVIDDLSSGKVFNVPTGVAFGICDLRRYDKAVDMLADADIVFHLACAHGGRGYVDTHRLDCFDNLSLDATVFRACREVEVSKVVFASSACAYPVDLQQDLSRRDLKLTEDMIDYRNIRQADGAYGHAKLSGELVLDAYVEAGYFEGVSCRQFTVYGQRVKMNHAIGALIAKALVKQDPFQVWGDGTQQRNWTFVSDTARGLILAAEKLNCGAVNIGSEERITVNEAVSMIFDILEWSPEHIEYQTNKPVGTLNRVADATKARVLLGWEPQYSFREGLWQTIDWFAHTYTTQEIRDVLERSLTER